MPRARIHQALVAASCLVLLGLLLACAWQSDDAFITWRSVDNAVHGYGLRWNVQERVQSYTSPLWMLVGLGCQLVFGELYFSVLGVSVLCTLAAAWVLLRLGKDTALVGLLVPWALIASNAFVDFSVSGLENPLGALLLAALGHAAWRRSLLGASLLGALLALCRPDAVVLAGPLLLWLLWLRRHEAKAWRELALGLTPLLAWSAFALAYYGSPIPNTAWAKLNLLIPKTELLRHGLHYLGQSLTRDPATLLGLGAACAVAWQLGGRSARALVLGCLFALGYVVAIGGDFMGGRFLYLPYVQALTALVLALRERPEVAASHLRAPVALLCLYGLLWPNAPTHAFDTAAATSILDGHGIADERAYYSPTTGLRQVLASWPTLPSPLPPYKRAYEGLRYRNAAVQGLDAIEVGYLGYFAGPHKIVLDRCALTDPFLPRIPYRPQGRWRVGHYMRDFPDGYRETRLSGINHLSDPRLARLYDDVRLVASGELWTAARWAAIWRLGTGQHRID